MLAANSDRGGFAAEVWISDRQRCGALGSVWMAGGGVDVIAVRTAAGHNMPTSGCLPISPHRSSGNVNFKGLASRKMWWP